MVPPVLLPLARGRASAFHFALSILPAVSFTLCLSLYTPSIHRRSFVQVLSIIRPIRHPARSAALHCLRHHLPFYLSARLGSTVYSVQRGASIPSDISSVLASVRTVGVTAITPFLHLPATPFPPLSFDSLPLPPSVNIWTLLIALTFTPHATLPLPSLLITPSRHRSSSVHGSVLD